MSIPDEETCYRAVTSKDARFDGWFVSAVTSTGIYCRPSCPAITPKRTNLRYYPTAAAAIAAGFRACLRCRPDAVPGSPEWSIRTDVVARAMRLIRDGVSSVDELAQRLGYSSRQLNRLMTEELGAGPLAVIRTGKAHTARILTETTTMPLGEIAFAAGFGSIRQFNETVREIYARTPGELRRATTRTSSITGGVLSVRLPYREPYDAAGLFAFLAQRAAPGAEDATATHYRRVVRLPSGLGTVELRLEEGAIRAKLNLPHPRDLPIVVGAVKRLCDLDADPYAIERVVGPEARGVRLPGAVDPGELAIRAVIGQQISVAAARTVAARFVEKYGDALPERDGSMTHAFPAPATLAEANPEHWPMPQARRRTLLALCGALARGDLVLDAGVDTTDAVAQLRRIPGIGEWTASYIAMRALSSPDVFLASDLGVLKAAPRRELPVTPGALAEHARRWRPYRSYATMSLWQRR